MVITKIASAAYMRALQDPKWLTRLIEVRTKHVAELNVAVHERMAFSFLYSDGYWETVWYEPKEN